MILVTSQLTGKLGNPLGKQVVTKGGPTTGKHGQSHTPGMCSRGCPLPGFELPPSLRITALLTCVVALWRAKEQARAANSWSPGHTPAPWCSRDGEREHLAPLGFTESGPNRNLFSCEVGRKP